MLVAFALTLSVIALAPGPAHATASPYSIHGMTTSGSGWSGSGTPVDPFRLNGLTIAPSGGYGIEIADSSATIILTNLTISGGAGSTSDAIHLFNATNVRIADSTFVSDRIGVYARASHDITIANVTVQTSQVGVEIEASRNVTLQDDRLALNEKNVLFHQAPGNTLTSNNLSITTGQTGLWFDDNASYDNAIDSTNVVNSVPVRWYTGVSGTTLPGANVDLPGMTNVAQVMVYNATDVVVDHAVAKAGRGNGIVVYNGHGVALEAPAAEGNTANGILVELSNGTRVSNASASNNTMDGVAVQSSGSTAIESSTLLSNGAPAVSVRAGSAATTLRHLTIATNPGGAATFSESASARVENSSMGGNGRGLVIFSANNVTVENSTFDSDTGVELTIDASRDIIVRSNALTGTGRTGIALSRSIALLDANAISGHSSGISFSASTGSTLTANTIASAGLGLSFDGAGSYDNAIATSNLVNGTPVRWYTNVAGPVTISGIRVETPGVTNVAQVMLYNSPNVTLDAPVASNGSAAGIVAFGSYGANVTGGTIVGNALQGISALQSHALRVRGATVFANGNDGILLTSSDAATIENNVIAGDHGRGIAAIASGAATIRGNAITGHVGAAIQASDTLTRGALAADHNTLTSNAGGGIVATNANVGSLFSNTISGNGGDGIALANAPVGATIQENTIANHTRAIRLTSTAGAQLLANTITIGDGQYGVWFDDQTSYNATAPPTNLVNGVPLRWYAGESGTTVTAPRVELRGITNVAQVMLYQAQNVTITGAIASNGTGNGIYVLRSANITLQQATAANDSRTGIAIESSNDTRVDRASSTLHAQDGISVVASPRAAIDSATVANVTGRGVLLDGDVAPILSNTTIASNGAAGVLVTGGSGARLQDLVVRANKGGGIALSGTNMTAGSVRSSVIDSNGDTGLSIASSSLGEAAWLTVLGHAKAIALSASANIGFHDNTISIAPGQTGFWFADRASYNSTIDASNKVNGVGMAWYANAAGATLRDITVDLRGITNVAQVMVYQSSGIALERVHAANGSARGIYVLATNGTTIDGSRADNDTGDGIAFESSTGALTVTASTSRDNGGDGVSSTSRVQVDGSTLAANRGAGARVAGGNLTMTSSMVASNVAGGARVSGGTLALAHDTLIANGAEGAWVSGGALNVTASTLQANAAGGVVADHAIDPAIVDDDLSGNGPVGIKIASASGVPRVLGDRLADHAHAIELVATRFGNYDANAISIGAGQTGFWFADETSYENTITTANTVNGEPVHWFTTLTGTQTQPVVLPNVRSEVRGATNIAQVMIFRSSYVDLPGLIASNGTARGLYLYGSSAIHADGANASNDALAGVHLQTTQSSIIRNLSAYGSGTGVLLTSSPNAIVSGVLADGATVGVSIADATSRDAHVDGVEVNGTARGVTDASWSGTSLAGNNLVVDAGAAKRVKTGSSLLFSDLMVTYRLDSDRIVSQNVSFGDPTNDSGWTYATLFHPSHAYAAPGTYLATLTATTVSGLVLSDNVTVEVVPPLSAPLALTAGAGSGNVTLTWSPPASDGASTILRYRVYRGDALAGEVAGNVLSFVDRGLQDGTRYLYSVAAVTVDGAGPNATAVATPVSPPGAPAAVTATARPNGAEIAWGAPSSYGGLPLGGYYVLRSQNGSAFATVALVGNVTNATVGGLTNGLTYTFAVRAFNMQGAGALSANVTVAPVGPASTPLRPRGLAGDASAVIVWDPPAENGGANITGYHVWRGVSNDTLAMLPDIIPANTTTFRDTGVSNGETYLFAVSATSSFGEGVRSSTVSVVPSANDTLRPVVFAMDPAPDALLTQSPVNISAQYVDNDGIVVSSVNVTLDDAPIVVIATTNGFTYAPDAPLAIGDHQVSVRVRDPTGNEANETWSFRILSADERVARVVASNETLVPPIAAPGDNVTAALTARNLGYAEGNATFVVTLDGHALAYEDVDLAPGESRDVFLTFAAPTVEGVYALTLGNASLTLTVSTTNATLPDATSGDGATNSTSAPANDTNGTAAPATGGPARPTRSHPPPRATPTGTNATPFLDDALLVGLVAGAALAMRRRT